MPWSFSRVRLTSYPLLFQFTAPYLKRRFTSRTAGLVAEPRGRARVAVVLEPRVARARRPGAARVVLRVETGIARHGVVLHRVPAGHRLDSIVSIVLRRVVSDRGAGGQDDDPVARRRP